MPLPRQMAVEGIEFAMEKRDILGVDVEFRQDNTLAEITVKYRIKNSYDVRNLLVPFYLIPEQEG